MKESKQNKTNKNETPEEKDQFYLYRNNKRFPPKKGSLREFIFEFSILTTTNTSVLFNVVIVILVILLVFYGISINKSQNDWRDRMLRDYQHITKTMDINTIIKTKETFKGCSNITTVDGNKIWIDFATNYNYRPFDLDEFLQIGDTIIKHKNSDTLYIHRNTKEYFFVFKEIIGKYPHLINIGI